MKNKNLKDEIFFVYNPNFLNFFDQKNKNSNDKEKIGIICPQEFFNEFIYIHKVRKFLKFLTNLKTNKTLKTIKSLRSPRISKKFSIQEISEMRKISIN